MNSFIGLVPKTPIALCTILAGLAGGIAQAQMFVGFPSFTVQPYTTMPGASLVDNLTVANSGAGFTVSGQVLVTLPPGQQGGGFLVYWEVSQQLKPGWIFTSTTTVLDGYSSPPPGALNSFGFAKSYLADSTGNPLSAESSVLMTLIAGAASWNPLSDTQGFQPHTAGTGEYLHQIFSLDGHYGGVTGGIWTIDVPLTSTVTAVPSAPVLTIDFVSSTLLSLSFQSLAGVTYLLEAQSVLGASNWTLVQSFVGNDSVQQMAVAPAAPEAYYRLRIQP